MTYELYRIDDLDRAHLATRLGDYPDFDTALATRDHDVIAQLTDRPAPPREISHVIVGPGRHGPRTKHPVVTFAGADVDQPDPAAEVTAIETWLHAIRAT